MSQLLTVGSFGRPASPRLVDSFWSCFDESWEQLSVASALYPATYRYCLASIVQLQAAVVDRLVSMGLCSASRVNHWVGMTNRTHSWPG